MDSTFLLSPNSSGHKFWLLKFKKRFIKPNNFVQVQKP